MITLSIATAAFLKRGSDYLLMKRAPNRKVAPGVWSGVGGHMECDELNNPQKTCLREVLEETGITKEQIQDLKLRYLNHPSLWKCDSSNIYILRRNQCRTH